jgi:hypothetical protein
MMRRMISKVSEHAPSTVPFYRLLFRTRPTVPSSTSRSTVPSLVKSAGSSDVMMHTGHRGLSPVGQSARG